jgi:hypothetical protein
MVGRGLFAAREQKKAIGDRLKLATRSKEMNGLTRRFRWRYEPTLMPDLKKGLLGSAAERDFFFGPIL